METIPIYQIVPELRVAIIAINEEGKILLQESDRWPGFLTVPGRGVVHNDTIEKTVNDLIAEEKLELNPKSKIQHLGYLEVINPSQFKFPNAHMFFEEFAVRVLNSGNNYHELYQILHEKNLVEEHTYKILNDYDDFLFNKHQPK